MGVNRWVGQLLFETPVLQFSEKDKICGAHRTAASHLALVPISEANLF